MLAPPTLLCFAIQGSQTHADLSAEARADVAAVAEKSANALLAEEERAKTKAAANKAKKQRQKQKATKQLTSQTASIEAADPRKAITESNDSATFLTQLFCCPLTQVSAARPHCICHTTCWCSCTHALHSLLASCAVHSCFQCGQYMSYKRCASGHWWAALCF